MRKYLFTLTLLALLLIANNASAQVLNKAETNEALKAKITELEKEVEELKNIDELKSDMHDSLLNKEKDNSGKIYNAAMLFIAIVSFFVTVGGIALTYFFTKIAAHQKKIDLVLDSKDFDKKVDAIEQRLFDIRFKERLNIASNAKRQFKTLCKDIDKIISGVTFIREHNVLGNEVFQEILTEWDLHISSYQREKEGFINKQNNPISPLDEADDDVENPEDELVSHIEELEVLLDNFEDLEKRIKDKLIEE